MATPARQTKIDAVAAAKLPDVRVVLEDIVDPHNAAAILRTCDALGVSRVHYLFDQVSPYDPKAVGKLSSSTANKWVDTVVHTDRAELETELRAAQFASVATTIHQPEAEQLWEADLASTPVALWVGNERTGLSEPALEYADRYITLPMRGFVESLNVSVATAIFLAEIIRQRHSGEG